MGSSDQTEGVRLEEFLGWSQARHVADSSTTETVYQERRRKLWKLVAFVLVAMLTLSIGAVVALRMRAATNLEVLPDPFASLTDRPGVAGLPGTGETASATDGGVNILILGSDSRISAGDPNQWTYGAQRTDAIMLAHISADRSSAYVMSIPRDSWVSIPGHVDAKINAAFSWGGPTLLIQTVEQLTNVRIDHFVVTDFEAFKGITDELGGVDLQTSAGTTEHLNGTDALAYVRERHHLPRGDFDRVKRQQNWIRALMHQALDASTLANPIKVASLINTVSGSVAVDSGFTVDEMTRLALSCRNISSPNVKFFTVPTSGTGRSADNQSIVLLDKPKFATLMEAVANDKVGDYLTAHQYDVDLLGNKVS